MNNEIPVSKILLIYYNNFFKFIFVFVVSFFLSSLFSDEILDKQYLSESYLQIGVIDGKPLDTIGGLFNKIHTNSFNTVLYETYDVPKNSSFKVRRILEEDSHLLFVAKTEKPEDNLILQNILQSVVRLVQRPEYDRHIESINKRIMRAEDDLVRIGLDIDRTVSNLDNAIEGEGSFPAIVAYLDIVEAKRVQKNIAIDKILDLKSKIESGRESDFIIKPEEVDSSNFSYPNRKTHLAFGIFMCLFFNGYLVYKEFKK